jgi:nucleoside-diphosphate-sugar epimerase
LIVVTGAGGFLGSYVVPLVRRASRARIIAMFRTRRRGVDPVPGVEMMFGDLRTERAWRQLPHDVTHVIHLAASIPQSPVGGPDIVLENVLPVVRLVSAARAWPRLKQIVYGSSVSVYGPSREALRESLAARPTTPYGGAKLAAEQLVDTLSSRRIAVASLRYSSIYGPRQHAGTVLPLFADRARRGLPLEIFDANRVQDFLHVDDAAQATWLACARTARGVFNVGSGRSVTMTQLAREILCAFDATGAGRIVMAPRAATGDPGVRMRIGRARRQLGYRPRVHLADGLRRLAREERR